jgi:hypothetical protein
MKRPVRRLTILIAMALAAPVALAGNNIVKCVDAVGHVTLTDQPCQSGTATVQLDSGPASGGITVEHYPAPAAAPRAGAPLKQALSRRVVLKRDVATLKAARAQLLLMDAAGRGQPQPALAAN